MKLPKILAFAGSLRKQSVNKQLVSLAADLAEKRAAELQVVDLLDFPMPLYNADDEEASGLPEHAKRLKALMREADGFMIASPEYNGSLTGVLKNTIDWVSRPEKGEVSKGCFADKVVMLLSASPGSLGGLRSLTHLRTILSGVGALVAPKEFGLPGAYQAFSEEGGFVDTKRLEQLESVVEAYLKILNAQVKSQN